jgi:hypothetical protein
LIHFNETHLKDDQTGLSTGWTKDPHRPPLPRVPRVK